MIAFPQTTRQFTKSLEPGVTDQALVYEIVHTTEYAYDRLIYHSEHQLRLTPVHDHHQALCNFQLQVSPEATIRPFTDSYGNEVLQLTINQPYQCLRMEARTCVALRSLHPEISAGPDYPQAFRRGEWDALQHLMIPDVLPEPQLQILSGYAHAFLNENQGAIVPTIDAINAAIFRDYSYKPGSTVVGTSVFEVYEKRQGVCQDFTNLMICLLRLLQLPAVYRTGYIYTGTEQNAHIIPEASHAWVEVYLPQLGWCGWDPTNGARAGADHIRLAAGRNSFEATPTAGTIFTPFQTETLTVHVSVQRRGATDS